MDYMESVWGGDKLNYFGHDSFPGCLGCDVLKFVSEHTIEELHQYYNNAYMDDGSHRIAEEISDWKINCPFYLDDANDFIRDSLYCENGYIINLDENVFEFWIGSQKESDENNRYGMEKHKDYHPCKCIFRIPLDEIIGHREDIQKLAMQMEKKLEDECTRRYRGQS